MNNPTKIITGVIVIALIAGVGYYFLAPKSSKQYFDKSVADYVDASKTGDQAEYQVALKLADKAFKLQKPDTTQNLYYAQLLAALNRKPEAITLLNKVKAEDSSAGPAVDALIKELNK